MKLLQIERLKVAAHFHHHEILPLLQVLDFLAAPKMVIFAVLFSGAGEREL
jgi:hypothetical protein